jgi:hypothetical protein
VSSPGHYQAHEEEVDMEYFQRYCKEYEETDKIDAMTIVDFVKHYQIFKKILPAFSKVSQRKTVHLQGLFQQAMKGDFDPRAKSALMAFFTSGNQQ